MQHVPGSPALKQLHALFVSDILPNIERHGRIYFRHLRCSLTNADTIQEMSALAWLWLVRLHNRGKDPRAFLTTFTALLARAVCSGRRLAGLVKAKDALNPNTQRQRGFRVELLPSSPRASHERLYALPHGQHKQDALEEHLRDNTQTPVPDQVQFQLDWPAWLATRTDRERCIIEAMIRNERTTDLSRAFRVSAARISQLRREFHEDWQRFCGEDNLEDVADD
jgi:hypothetical protein